MSSVLTFEAVPRASIARVRAAMRISEIALVGVFSLLSLSSMWLCAGVITRAYEETAVLHWFFPSGVGLFMALVATSIWLVMLPSLVLFVRDEFRLAIGFFARVIAKEAR